MEEPRNETVDTQPLHDEELSEVAGGMAIGPKKRIYCGTISYCGFYNEFTDEISYCPCSKCHTPMYTSHLNPKWVCDCCDNSEFFPVEETWMYSREQLISDAIN